MSQQKKNTHFLTIVDIAKACHEANRVLCEAYGDWSQPLWEEAEDWQRDSAINGVRFVIDNPDAPASANHDSWSEHKLRDGWTYGPVKDPEQKTHPCLVPFDQLPPEQQAKDVLFHAVCQALIPLL